MSLQSAALYVVATPIGNLQDLSPRAREVLSQVDLVAAEDTRHTRQLFRHFGIDTPLTAVHEHNERERVPELLAELAAGRRLALVSDAGTPLVSDPGFRLVRAARLAGYRVIAVPGPSSLLAALSVAGLPTDRFVFEGFLPAKPAARRARLAALAAETRTLVFFESSHRIAECLADMRAAFGDAREAVVARELTKLFEELLGGTLAEVEAGVAADANRRRGEFVVMLQGAEARDEQAPDAEVERVLTILLDEVPVKQAVSLAARLTGRRKNALYALATSIAMHKNVVIE